MGLALLVAYLRPVTDDGLSLGPATWLVIPGFAYGVVCGVGQQLLIGPLGATTVLVLSIGAALPFWFGVAFLADFNRMMPIPGGGDPLDPLLSDLVAGIKWWSAGLLGVACGLGGAALRPRPHESPANS